MPPPDSIVNNPPLGETEQTGQNVFYDQLLDALQARPITSAQNTFDGGTLFCLRRLWIPRPGDALDSSAFRELVVDYSKNAIPAERRGVSLLESAQLVNEFKYSGSAPSEEELRAVADQLPPRMRLGANRAIVLGAQRGIAGKRYIGLLLTKKSNDRIYKEHERIAAELPSHRLRIPRRKYIGHVSLFTTRDQDLAGEICQELKAVIPPRGFITLGEAEPQPIKQRRSGN